MQGKILIKNKAQGERAVKGLIKKQTRTKVDDETGIPGAGKQLEKLEKRIKSLEGELAGIQKNVNEFRAWMMEHQRREGK